MFFHSSFKILLESKLLFTFVWNFFKKTWTLTEILKKFLNNSSKLFQNVQKFFLNFCKVTLQFPVKIPANITGFSKFFQVLNLFFKFLNSFSVIFQNCFKIFSRLLSNFSTVYSFSKILFLSYPQFLVNYFRISFAANFQKFIHKNYEISIKIFKNEYRLKDSKISLKLLKNFFKVIPQFS